MESINSNASAWRMVRGTADKQDGQRELSIEGKTGKFACSVINDSGSIYQKFLVVIGVRQKIALYDPQTNSRMNVAVTNKIFKEIFPTKISVNPKPDNYVNLEIGKFITNLNSKIDKTPELYMLKDSKDQQPEVRLVLKDKEGKPFSIDGTLDLKDETIKTKEGAVYDIKERKHIRNEIESGNKKIKEEGNFEEGKLHGPNGTRFKELFYGGGTVKIEEKGNFNKGELEGKGGTRKTTKNGYPTEEIGTFANGKLTDGLEIATLTNTRIEKKFIGGILVDRRSIAL